MLPTTAPPFARANVRAHIFRSRASCLPFLAIFLAAFVSTAHAALPNGVSAGDVGTDSAVLWARTTAPGDVRFTVWRVDRGLRVVAQAAVNVTDTSVPAKSSFSGLVAGARYIYDAVDATGARALGTFRTAGAPGTRGALRFGVSGDWRGELRPYPAVANARSQGLDFFVKLGDTIYADYPSPAVNKPQATTLADFRLKQAEVYSSRFGVNVLAQLQTFAPIFSMIDDHEVTDDFAGGAPAASDSRFGETSGLINQTQMYRNALQAFTEYNAIQPRVYPSAGDARTDGRPDLYRMQRYGDVAALFMVDARSFRDAPLPPVQNPFNPIQIGNFVRNSFDPNRTMLSRRQLQRLLADLLAAHNAGVTWKFVLLPQPIQNLGLIAASDRYEGYAAERTAILKFVEDNQIRNVVFIAADVHGTFVNNLTYQLSPVHPQVPTHAFEITTGPVAFEPTFGNAILAAADSVRLAPGITLLDVFLRQQGVQDIEAFNALPDAAKNAAVEQLVNLQLTPLGYDPLGIEPGSPVNARLTFGSYTSVFDYGWTEFSVHPATLALQVSTFGIEQYDSAELEANPAAVINRRPRLVSQFVVTPQ